MCCNKGEKGNNEKSGGKIEKNKKTRENKEVGNKEQKVTPVRNGPYTLFYIPKRNLPHLTMKEVSFSHLPKFFIVIWYKNSKYEVSSQLELSYGEKPENYSK